MKRQKRKTRALKAKAPEILVQDSATEPADEAPVNGKDHDFACHLVVSKDALRKVWPEARKHLLASIEATLGTHDVNDVYAGIFRGDYQLWVGNRSAGVTQVITYPNARAVQVFLAGGDLDEIRHAGEVLAKGAKKLGFDRIEFGGRRGFVRALPDYQELATYMVRIL